MSGTNSFPVIYEFKGQRFMLRPVRPEDLPVITHFASNLDVNSRRLRFFTAGMNTDSYARKVAKVAHNRSGEAIGAFTPTGELVGLVEIYGSPTVPHVAEVAIVVAEGRRRLGLADELLRVAANLAHRWGITHFKYQHLADNTAAKELATSLGANDLGTLESTVETHFFKIAHLLE